MHGDLVNTIGFEHGRSIPHLLSDPTIRLGDVVRVGLSRQNYIVDRVVSENVIALVSIDGDRRRTADQMNTRLAWPEVSVHDVETYGLRVAFDRRRCSRCAGSGRHAGGPCHGCNGRGTQLSPEGRRARARFDDATKAMIVNASEIVVGDVALVPDAEPGRASYQLVEQIARDLDVRTIQFRVKPKGKAVSRLVVMLPNALVRRWSPEVHVNAMNAALDGGGCTLESSTLISTLP